MKTKIKQIILQQEVVNRFMKEEHRYIETHVELESPHPEPCYATLRGSDYKVGDCINYTIKPLMTRFSERLERIGITVKLGANLPWIYLDEVNGVRVKDKFMAEHGFTAFTFNKVCKFTDRRKVFKKIRSMLTEHQDSSKLPVSKQTERK